MSVCTTDALRILAKTAVSGQPASERRERTHLVDDGCARVALRRRSIAMNYHVLILGIISAGFLVAMVWAVVDYRRYKQTRKDVLRVEPYFPSKAVDSLSWPASPSASSRHR
jgi:heme/copper-type cytochrome/quinol oxidase subunit 2